MASVPDLSDQESENEPTKNSSTSNQESEYESANEEEVVPDLSDDSEKSSSEKVISDDKSCSEDCSISAPLPEEIKSEGDNVKLIPAPNNDENNYLADEELSGDEVIFDEADDGDHSKVEVESNISKSSENSKVHKESKKAEAEDKRNPQYIPRKGAFYEHDDRNDDADENSDNKEPSGVTKESQPTKKTTTETKKEKKKPQWQTKDCWGHDRFDETQQAPKSKQELVYSYGYDIRVENEAPKLQQRSKYGNGPRKYDRKSDDLSAYTKKTNRKPVVKKDLSRDVEKGLQSSSDTSEAHSKPNAESAKKSAENVEQPTKEKKNNAPKAERKNNQNKHEKFQQPSQNAQPQQPTSQSQAQNQSQSHKNISDKTVNQTKHVEKQDKTFEKHDRAARNDKHERFDNRNDNRIRNDKFDRQERPPKTDNYQRGERVDRSHKHDNRHERFDRNNDYPQHRPERYDQRNNYNNNDRQDRFERGDRYDRNFERFDNKNDQRFNNHRNDERFANRRTAPPPTRDYSDVSKQDYRNGHLNRNDNNNKPYFKKSDFPDLPSSNSNVSKNPPPSLSSQQKKEVIYYSTKDGAQTSDSENKNINNGVKSDKPEVIAEVKKQGSQQQQQASQQQQQHQQQPQRESTPKHNATVVQQKGDNAKGQTQNQMHVHNQNMTQQQHHQQPQQHQLQSQHQREQTPSQEQLKSQAETVAYYDPTTQPGAQAGVPGAAAGMIPQQNYIMAYYNDPVSCHSTAGTTTAVTGLQAQMAMAPTGYYPADQTASAGQNNFFITDLVYQQAYHMPVPNYAPQNRYPNTTPSAESNRYLQTTAPIPTNPSIHMFGSAMNYPAGYPAFPAQAPQQAPTGQIHLGAANTVPATQHVQAGYQSYYRNAPTYYDISNARHKDGDAAVDQFDKSKANVDVNKQLSVVNQ